MKGKRKRAALLVLLVMSLLCGCSSAVISIQKNTGTSLERKCVIVTDWLEREIEVEEGSGKEVALDITAEEGTLDVELLHKDTEEIIFQKTFDQTFDASDPLTVMLSAEGTYKIRLTMQKFSGNYKIEWYETEEDEHLETVRGNYSVLPEQGAI